MDNLSRRDFLKLISSGTAAAFASPFLNRTQTVNEQPGIIVVLLDAMSAKNLSLYGYARHTTPQLEKFANRSTVYNTHYSAGNFTPTGTASTLTGMLPWKHRAFSNGGLIKQSLVQYNPFTIFGNDYLRLGFGQNPWADRLLSQFIQDIDVFLPSTTFSFRKGDPLLDGFRKDRAIASIATQDFLLTESNQLSGAAFLGYLYRTLAWRNSATRDSLLAREYSMGIPMVDGYVTPYLNEDVYDGILAETLKLYASSKPFIAYFHLYSPHWPYRPRNDFSSLFHDNYKAVWKPPHPLSNHLSWQILLQNRMWYDQQLAQIDSELGQLFDQFESHGILEHSYVVVTSDHGEMFERGIMGHGQKMVYEPVIRIPLLIHAPGQTERVDVTSPTSNIDLLPTLLTLAGKKVPATMDGQQLPQLGGTIDAERPIFSMYSVQSSAFLPLTSAVIAMRVGIYKIIAYFGYGKYNDFYELYNLERDPEELKDLSKKDTVTLARLKEQLLDHLADANHFYAKQ